MATTAAVRPGSSIWFAEAARQLNVVARGRALNPVSFRSPPQDPSVDRSLRRHPDGAVTVSVRLRDRDTSLVLADMVDGILAANRTSDPGHREAFEATVAHMAPAQV